MFIGSKRFAFHLVAVGSAALLSLGAAACSSDEGDDGEAAKNAAGGSAADTRVASGSDEQQIEATLRALRESYNAGDGEAFCAKLTDAGRAEVVTFGRSTGNGRTCATITRRFGSATSGGQRPVAVRSVEIDGDRAVVRASGGLSGRAVQALRMSKDGGEWKVVDPLSGPAAGAQAGEAGSAARP